MSVTPESHRNPSVAAAITDLHERTRSALEAREYAVAALLLAALEPLYRAHTLNGRKHDSNPLSERTRLVPLIGRTRTEFARHEPQMRFGSVAEHPTCIETTNNADMARGHRTFACGPECPDPAADGQNRTHLI